MQDDGFSYDHWLWLLTTTIDQTLRDENVDLNYQDNRLLRDKELDYISAEWERVKFFERHLPTTENLTACIDHFVKNISLLKRGQRREFRLAIIHEEHVKEWLASKQFHKVDYQYILDCEQYLATQFFEQDTTFDLYTETDYENHKKFRLQAIFNRFLKNYPDFYQPYELRKDTTTKS